MRNAKLILLCGVAATLTVGAVAPALADGYERPRAVRKAAPPKPAPVPLAGERIYYRDRVVEKIVEVPVDRIVEKRVEVPVDRPVIVEKRVEVPVERIVEKRVEVPVDRVVYRDRIVDRPVDRIVEKRVEVPVDRPVIQIVEKPVDRIVVKKVVVPVDRPVDRIVYRDRIVDRPVDRIVEKRVAVPVDRPVYIDRPVDRIVERRVEVPVERIVYVERPRPTPVVMAPVRVISSHDCGCDHDAGYSVSSSGGYSSQVIDERVESYSGSSSASYGGSTYGVGELDYAASIAMGGSRTGYMGGWTGGRGASGYTAWGGGYATGGGGAMSHASAGYSSSVQTGSSISNHVITSGSMGGRYVGGSKGGAAGGRR
jgi:hypothetical protein